MNALRSTEKNECTRAVVESHQSHMQSCKNSCNEVGEEFEVKVGVHQGSVLSPLLFTIVLEALSKAFRGGLPREILYADDLVLIAQSDEDMIKKIQKWKNGFESKGLRVNVIKNKIYEA